MTDRPIFAYGTLMNSGVLSALLGRVPRRREARLPGHTAIGVVGKVYPVAYVDPAGILQGVLLMGLSPSEREIIDAFEDPSYLLAEVVAHERDRCVDALAYRVSKISSLEASGSWSLQAFEREHLDGYLDGCRRVRAAILRGERGATRL